MKLCPSDSILIGNLDVRVTAGDIKAAICRFTPQILFVKIILKFPLSCAFVKFSDVAHISKTMDILQNEYIILYQLQLKFDYFRKNVYKEKCGYNLIIDTSEVQFDLSPEDPNLPSIHMLNDDSLMLIFNYLSITQLVNYRSICRRLEGIINLTFIKKLRKYKEGCIITWLIKNDLDKPLLSIPLFKKCGHVMKKLEIGLDTTYVKFNSAISVCCPNLEELKFNNFLTTVKVKGFANTCKSLKKLSIQTKIRISEDEFSKIFKNFKNLEIFQIIGSVELARKNFAFVSRSRSLKEFSCFTGLESNKCPWRKLFRICRKLEVFNLGSPIKLRRLYYAAKLCPNLRTLGIKLPLTEDDVFNSNLFPNLTKLSICAKKVDLNRLSCKGLEELCISDNTFHTTSVIGDFSSLKRLHHFSMITFPSVSSTILENICSCKELKCLEISIRKEKFDSLLMCIEKLTLLETVRIKELYFNASIAKSLKKACKERKTYLALHFNLCDYEFIVNNCEDYSQIIKGVNYEIDISGATYVYVEDEDSDDIIYKNYYNRLYNNVNDLDSESDYYDPQDDDPFYDEENNPFNDEENNPFYDDY